MGPISSLSLAHYFSEAARGWGFWGRVGAFPDGLRGFGGRAPQPPEASQTFFLP